MPTGALNQAVRRNMERFPEDFAFRLSKAEFEHWKSQIVISNPSAKMGLRYAPLVFTQEGVAMLSAVLRSDRAVQMSIAIVRTFVRMRELMAHLKELPLIAKPIGGAFYYTVAALAQALRPSPYSVMKNASATTGNARPTHAASVHPPSAYAQPPSAEPTAQPMKKAAT